MKVAVLDDNKGNLAYFEDFLHKFKPDLFDSLVAFEKTYFGQYDVIILAHRFNGYSWGEIYNNLRSDCLFIVNATFEPLEYKKQYPGIYRDITKEIKKHKNVLFKQKHEHEDILELVIDKYREKEIRNLTEKIVLAYVP